jgi:hypothetical protein
MLSSGLRKAMKALLARREGARGAGVRSHPQRQKACIFLCLMSCLEPKEVVEESRFSSYNPGPSEAKVCLQRLYWF